jgi:hypothetical protein
MSAAFRPQEYDEVRGQLFQVEEADGGCLALIDKIPVLLPEELAGTLQDLIGLRVGILKLDGFHIRDLDGKAHA